MSTSYTLLEFGTDPMNSRYEDLQGRPAFTIKDIEENPNLLVRLTREKEWSQQHRDIMGPSNAFFYLGPLRSPGWFVYGNGGRNAMADALKRKREGSVSRYYNAQNGKEFKWKLNLERLECYCGHVLVATWERGAGNDAFDAKLVVKTAGLATVTEILTTLTLNRMADQLGW